MRSQAAPQSLAARRVIVAHLACRRMNNGRKPAHEGDSFGGASAHGEANDAISHGAVVGDALSTSEAVGWAHLVWLCFWDQNSH